ncbi:MAG: Ig-like domain-containing protein [Gammaproteobacteria bacterium]
MHYQIVTYPEHGSLSVTDVDGSFTYTPSHGYSGKDSFQFDIDNGVKKSNTATVSITVKAPPSGGGGGGAFGGGILVLIAGLFVLSRRRL